MAPNKDSRFRRRTHGSSTKTAPSQMIKRDGYVLMLLLLFTSWIPSDTFSIQQASNHGRNMHRRKLSIGTKLSVHAEVRFGKAQNHVTDPDAKGEPIRQTLSPIQIFYPEFASLYDVPDPHPSSDGVPFYQSFQLLKRALEVVASADSANLERILGKNFAQGTCVLRIEQIVSHTVDPLGWLHAQNKRQLSVTKDPLFYIQSTVETAVFGAAWIWNQPTKSDQFWDILSKLPEESYLYGGERFDQHVNERHKDWKEFGSTLWMLPAVELREEPTENVVNSTATTISPKVTTLAVHLVKESETSTWQETARMSLELLQRLNDAVTHSQVPSTTLPPVIVRESTYGPDEIDGQELYEQGVTAALDAFESPDNDLQKVVLGRRVDLKFQADLTALDILRKWKYCGIHEGGNMFYLRPSTQEFFGCTPERLFTVQKNANVVLSEALAGTRPRGTSQAADEELLRDLFGSMKDREENMITAKFIRSVFSDLGQQGLLEMTKTLPSSFVWEDSDGKLLTNQTTSSRSSSSSSSGYFVRRLRHLQHICQRFSATLRSLPNQSESASVVAVLRYLLANLHPTPAVCGFPAESAKQFIRQHESIGFDRGFYAGPVGYMGRNAADILVAIRSGLISRSSTVSESCEDFEKEIVPRTKTTVSVYAGAGIVPGSTVQGEWSETSYKLGVISSLFPQSPMTLQSSPTPNVAWASAFIEELIRNGVTQFFVCPGSRSTPLVVAIARAARSNVGVVHAVSIHDERGAGFRAVGYARGANRPAAIITSSGTAIANLYPAIVEAGMDGVPLLVLSADRPYESRDTGSNQAIDQVKAYSSSYIRWFRDILPPHDDVPVSVALSDAAHAVSVARTQRGPVHVNIQFRENLAPDAGPIRNDNRVDSIAKFNGYRFTDVPGFSRWSSSGDRWLKSYTVSSLGSNGAMNDAAVVDIARLIIESERGILVVGNLRTPTSENEMEDLTTTSDLIAKFAESIGFPIIAGAQNGLLRFSSNAVIPFAEHILKNPTVAENIKPDLIIQIGSALVSTEVPNMISKAKKDKDKPAYHVLLHPHYGSERVDSSFTVSHRISAEITPFLKALSNQLDTHDSGKRECSSQLAPLVGLGRRLQAEMPLIINKASRAISVPKDDRMLTEPQVVLGLSMMLSNSLLDQSLFLSNSMPVRDVEFFLYPTHGHDDDLKQRGSLKIGSNRGASGIDGIVSSALGFAESTGVSTTLVIGDLAALHDLNSFHAFSSVSPNSKYPITTLLINNDGGGIFSFLPIAKHGPEVSFNEFFGTPTSSFSYKEGIEAFGLPVKRVSSFDSFCHAYAESFRVQKSSVIEAQVAGREANVEVHRQITQSVNSFLDGILKEEIVSKESERLPAKFYSEELGFGSHGPPDTHELKTLVLIHGWMGDKSEWDDAGEELTKTLPAGWVVVAIDLPGHGASRLLNSSERQRLRAALNLDVEDYSNNLCIDSMARSVLRSLSRDYGIKEINALAGYSLGGRVALAMKRLSARQAGYTGMAHLGDSCKLILLSAYPGKLPRPDDSSAQGSHVEDSFRMDRDDRLSREIAATFDRAALWAPSRRARMWTSFLSRWYGAPIWGDLKGKPSLFDGMVTKRSNALVLRGKDLAAVLRHASPARNDREEWHQIKPENTLFLAGSLDSKYVDIGKQLRAQGVNFADLPGAGHALLVESANEVGRIIVDFVLQETAKKLKVQWESIGENTTIYPSFASKESSLDTLDKENQEKRIYQSGLVSTSPVKTTMRSGTIESLDFDSFRINLVNGRGQQNGIFGIGWGDKAKKSSQLTQREGFIIQLTSCRGSKVGVGEVSPLPGLHKESLEEAMEQLMTLRNALNQSPYNLPQFDATSVFALDGELSTYLKRVAQEVGCGQFLPSVFSGLEMAMISLSAQVVGEPLHQALSHFSPANNSVSQVANSLPLNGLLTRGSNMAPFKDKTSRYFPSLKVKVGHQEAMDDATSILLALERSDFGCDTASGVLRADANRAWEDETALQFATALEGTGIRTSERLEFVEEPLKKQEVSRVWSLEDQVHALERWHKHTGMLFALDESVADIAELHDYNFTSIRSDIQSSFGNGSRGCAAFVLKPALIGLELSIQIARFVRSELGIGVTFSSSFDSGVGLAYTAMLGALSDSTSGAKMFSHGVGTFTMLDGDTLSPAFASYVADNGVLNVPSLSRALYGLGLDELRDSYVYTELMSDPLKASTSGNVHTSTLRQSEDSFEATAATSSSGREINLVVSLPLPFSADIAFTRFTDLPQQSRWSPWIRSVRYVDDGRETEWTLNVRGVQFRWRAVSSLLESPLRGIQWESVSGLKNKGVVEFDETDDNASLMKVRMSILTPRILASIFQSTSIFVEDFLRNKLLKWSLEMFRDVVKGDLALERGDVELGDALFGSVEGKASAIEATLSLVPRKSGVGGNQNGSLDGNRQKPSQGG